MADAKKSDSLTVQIENLKSLENRSEFTLHEDSLGLLYYFIAFRYAHLNDNQNLIDYCSKAIHFFEIHGYSDYQLSRCYLWRGNAYQAIGYHDHAQEDLEKIILNLEITGKKGYESLSDAYRNRAANYCSMGEYESSIYYLEKFIHSTRFDSIDIIGQAGIYRELSIAQAMYKSKQRLKDAQESIEKAESICSALKVDDVYDFEQVVLNIMHKAFIHMKLEEHEKAISIYKQAISLMSDLADHYLFNKLYIIACINIAELYLELEDCREVKPYLDRADDLFGHSGNPNFLEIDSDLEIAKTKYYLCDSLYEMAANQIYQHKTTLIKNYAADGKSLKNFPYKEFLIDAYLADLELINVSIDKGVSTRLPQLKTKALQLDSLINYYLEDLYFNSSMWALKENLDDFYKLAIDISYESADLNDFWYYSEQRSNMLLLKNQQYESDGKEAKQTRMDEDLSILKREAATLDNTIYFLQGSLDINKQDSLQALLNKNRADQLALLEKRTATSEYEMVNTIISLDDFDKRIDDNTTVLHFQFGTDSLYVLKIEKGEANVYNIGKSNEIKNLITSWFSFTSQSGEQSSELNSEDKVSTQLFDNLIKPIGPQKMNVLILPDEELYFLSFDALTNSTGEYLIQDHCIRYDLSGTLAVKHLVNQKIKINDISAFLPNYSHSDLAQLSNTAEDIKSLEGHPNLNLFSEKDIDQDQFIASLQESDLVHFGGHAIHVDENNQYSHLAFVSEKEDEVNMISLGDLYSLNSISPLIALPACNTGTGAVMQGEGISSLSRGFFHAGAQSVISSLWNVNDKSTSFIMNAFYENLKAGESTADALRLAKLNYLETTPDFLRQPYLWSGLILTGSDSTAEISKSLHVLIQLTLALFFLLGIGYFIMSRSNSTKIEAVPN